MYIFKELFLMQIICTVIRFQVFLFNTNNSSKDLVDS